MNVTVRLPPKSLAGLGHHVDLLALLYTGVVGIQDRQIDLVRIQ